MNDIDGIYFNDGNYPNYYYDVTFDYSTSLIAGYDFSYSIYNNSYFFLLTNYVNSTTLINSVSLSNFSY